MTRRMVRECIRHGIAGVRVDDQPIEGKRKTQSAGVEVVPVEQAIARYRAAVDMKKKLDPDFVVMARTLKHCSYLTRCEVGGDEGVQAVGRIVGHLV